MFAVSCSIDNIVTDWTDEIETFIEAAQLAEAKTTYAQFDHICISDGHGNPFRDYYRKGLGWKIADA